VDVTLLITKFSILYSEFSSVCCFEMVRYVNYNSLLSIGIIYYSNPLIVFVII